jgi:hypothetical protein
MFSVWTTVANDTTPPRKRARELFAFLRWAVLSGTRFARPVSYEPHLPDIASHATASRMR